MSGLSTLRRVLVGVSLVVLGSIAMFGCTDVIRSNAPSNLPLGASISDPVQVGNLTQDQLNNANVQPVDNSGILALQGLTLPQPTGTTETLAVTGANGNTPQLDVTLPNDLGNGSLPIVRANDGSYTTTGLALLPPGDSTLSLGSGTNVTLGDSLSTGVRSAPTLANSLNISNLMVKFSVSQTPTPHWTLPSGIQFNLQRIGTKYQVRSSFLKLTWNGITSVQPNRPVKVVVSLYDGTVSRGLNITKYMTYADAKTAYLSGLSAVTFTRMDISLMDFTNGPV